VLLPGGGQGGFGSDKSDVFGVWFDGDGKALTPFFPVARGALTKFDSSGRPSDVILLHAIAGGGAVLAVDWQWKAFIASGSMAVSLPPDWLEAHAGHDFTTVRGNRAYALLPRTAGDHQMMELYSTQGNRCGSLTFPVGGLTVGADGSVIGASGPAACTKTVWPGLLR
jgi:subtilisin family serine protease